MIATATTRLAGAVLLGTVACGCHSAAQPGAPASSSRISTPVTTVTTSTQAVAPVTRIQLLPVRPVTTSQPTTPQKCPVTNPAAPAPPAHTLVTCDVARTTRYTLGPEVLRLQLTHVDAPKPLASDFFEVNLTLDPASATAWASYTAAHLHDHVAFVRDDVVLEAPLIEEQVSSGQIALTTQTAPAADQLAQLAARPA
jgi:preprotein translocase subunit SecD